MKHIDNRETKVKLTSESTTTMYSEIIDFYATRGPGTALTPDIMNDINRIKEKCKGANGTLELEDNDFKNLLGYIELGFPFYDEEVRTFVNYMKSDAVNKKPKAKKEE